MTLALDFALGLSLIALLEIGYRLGRRHKARAQRMRGFIEGWNAAVDAIVPVEDAGAWTADTVDPPFAIDPDHHEAQLRSARAGSQ